jgi:branched-chain amino acid transport system substrate-binding protein
MGDSAETPRQRGGLSLRRPRRLRRLTGAALAATLLLAVTACGDDDDGGGGSSSGDEPSQQEATDLLGPEEQASGEPVRIGMASDGATDAFDNTDELRSAEATAEFWNTHRGGVGGRPVEVVTCEMRNDPATAADCANQFVEEGVVAVAVSQSGVTDSLWEPLHEAGVPTFVYQTSSEAIATDTETSFVMFNPLATLYGSPIAAAEEESADSIAFVVIDVPQALESFDSGEGPEILENAGLEYELIAIPPGTADMTSQMQEVANSDAGVVQVVGNDAFCIAAFNGLTSVGYDGAITSITQCITDATREAVSGEVLDQISVLSTYALGAEDDETFQLYQAVMSTFGEDVEDVNNATAMGAYATMGALLTSLDGLEGDVTPETVVETVKAMPEAELPGGGGITFQCGGSASEEMPAVCTNQSLRAELDAEGNPSSYEVADGSDAMS